MITNHILLGGHLTADPELRVTPKGTAVCTLSVAYNPPGKRGDNAKKPEPVFFEVTQFGKPAEKTVERFHKGDCVFIDGQIGYDSWEDKTTKKRRSKLTVKAQWVQDPHVTTVNFCRIILTANLTRDPEMKKKDDVPLAIVGLAHNPMPYTDAAGAKHQPETIFVDAIAREVTANNIGAYLKLGSHVLVEASPYTSLYTPEGSDREIRQIKLRIDNIQFLRRESEAEKPESAAPAPAGARRTATAPVADGLDEDVPY